MSQHTPGPWKFDADAPPPNCSGVIDTDQGELCWLCPWSDMPDTLQANARLIASAPEMLAALKEWTEAHRSAVASLNVTCVCGACAAIAKAEGRS